MKVAFSILLFMACINISTGIVLNLNFPGTEYVQLTNPTNMSEYEEHFNASQIADSWGATDLYGIPVIGDIFSGFQFLFRGFQYLIDGFPMFLFWMSDSFILSATAKASFTYIIWALRGMASIVFAIFVIEFISGRYMTE